MVFNTATVAGVVTPAVIQTFLSHYLSRKRLAEKPTAHISYDEGLQLVTKFLSHASHHPVEDIQRFTSQWVPSPRWVKLDQARIPEAHLARAAAVVQAQLGPGGIERVGGKTWWQWRRPGSEVAAEWIEMRADYQARKSAGDPGKRVMLYVHGGGYYFGSVDAHRYQLQRHARKLQARVFAPRYRLAPQFPFPCGLHDCLAAYLYLLTTQDPTTIVFAGDSAGAGMILSMLVILRDQGLPLPAGAILISPWVDLTHSFPSVIRDNPLDYIPPHGFHHQPSPSWPPPNADDMLAIKQGLGKSNPSQGQQSISPTAEADAIQGFHVHHSPDANTQAAIAGTSSATTGGARLAPNSVPGPGHNLSVMINGELVEIKDQIQMYAPNHLVSHPLVSQVLQPSLGGLPPLLVLSGGGETLRDEQIYIAHKAANPAKYPPGDAFLDENAYGNNRDQVNQWKPTDVQLQVWDDLCHVVTTLSFTRPAKLMFRSIAQFGAWALARAQKTEIDILDDDAVSFISKSGSETEDKAQKEDLNAIPHRVGKAGDPLPHFKQHMIRQRVDRHGNISELEPESELPGCTVPAGEIGVVKEGPVKKWMAAKVKWDTKYASSKRKVQKQRAREFAKGYEDFGDGEIPPPSALVGRRRLGTGLQEEERRRSTALSLWSQWGSKHDEETLEHEQEIDSGPGAITSTPKDGARPRTIHDLKAAQGREMDRDQRFCHNRSRSRRRIVTDEHQTDESDIDEDTPASVLHSKRPTMAGNATDSGNQFLTPDFVANGHALSSTGQKTTVHESELKRPKADGIAYPFSLKKEGASASMTTLTSAVGVRPVADVRPRIDDVAVKADENGAAGQAPVESRDIRADEEMGGK